MVFPASLRKTFLISIIWHIALFTIFGFSFGNKIFKPNYTQVAFWGAVLRNSDLIYRQNPSARDARGIFFRRPIQSLLAEPDKEYLFTTSYYSKPLVSLALNEDKIIYTQKSAEAFNPRLRKEPVIIFHPQLPYHFLLYFKDRQAVHIELMFNVASSGKTSSIAIKRKISSGNLEVDLLAMRYISHYLFIEQSRFTPGAWQAVKIDLSAKND